jgi:hypothetical protein
MTALAQVDDALAEVREDPTYHWVGLVAGIILGLALASIHWIGLIIGGMFVGVVAANLVRALFAGLGFGILVVLLWMALVWYAGSLSEVLAMGQIAWVAIAMGLVLPMFGSLIRGVV